MKRIYQWRGLLVCLLALIVARAEAAPAGELAISARDVSMLVGDEAILRILNAAGHVSVSSSDRRVATAEISDGALKIAARQPGSATLTVGDQRSTATVAVSVRASAATYSAAASEGHLAWLGRTIAELWHGSVQPAGGLLTPADSPSATERVICYDYPIPD